ncbi:MFS transporter [Paraburkholderia sediminicola]|uniref:MFS transporter n=1 Tax=Paraburkholderia sediminicola TaxID=458836 RepID=UPI000E71CC21
MNALEGGGPTHAGNTDAGPEGMRRQLLLAIVGLGVTQIIGWGTIFYPPAVVAQAMGRAVGSGREAAFWGITIVMLAGALSSTRIGTLIDQIGARKPLVFGCIATAGGLLLLSIATGPIVFWSGWCLLGVASPLVLSTGTYAAMVQIAGSRARKAVSALTLFSGLSATVFYPLTHLIDDKLGWRAAYVSFAVLHIAVCLPIFLAVLPHKVSRHLMERVTIPPELKGRRATAAFWSFVLLISTNTVVASGLTLHLVTIFGVLGLSAGAAVGAASLTGPSQVGGRLIELAAGKRYPPIFTALIAAVLQLFAFVLLEIAKKPVMGIWAFAVIYGLSNGLMTIARVAVPLSLFGSKRYGAVSGKLNVAFSIATAIAPVCFAIFLRHTVPSILLIVCTSLALLGVATAVVLCSLWHAEVRQESRI